MTALQSSAVSTGGERDWFKTCTFIGVFDVGAANRR
ncbi:hypothetical protein J3R03_004241 [Actinoplanes couchii]|nr:hypothetical protein [Actinoplanes couchii]